MDDNQEIEVYEETRYKPLPFCVDALRRVSVLYIVWLLAALGLSLIVYFVWSGAPTSSVRPSLFVYYLIMIIHVLYRLKHGGRQNVLAPDILFIFVYTLFHLSYVTLYTLKFVPYLTEIFIFESSIPKALFIINLGLVAFLLGYEVMGTKRGRPNEPGPILIPTQAWSMFGWIGIVIALLIHIGIIWYLGLEFLQRYGYSVFQDVARITGSYWLGMIWRQSLRLMIISQVIYCMTSAMRYGKMFKSKVVLGAVVMFFSMIIMEGDRGPLVQMGVPLILIRHYFIKPIRIRYLSLIAVGAVFLFTLLGVVRTIVFKPTKMIEEYKYQRQAGVVTWKSPLIEMGGSFLAVNITADQVPKSEAYWLGASWRDATVHIVPFLSGYFARKGWSTWAPSTWLTWTYFGRGRASRAYTIAAEGYLNFGYLGVLIELGLFGFFIRWVGVRLSKKPSVMWGVILFVCFGQCILGIRNHVGIVANVCVQVMVLVWLMNMFLGDEPEYVYELESGQMEPSDFEAQHY